MFVRPITENKVSDPILKDFVPKEGRKVTDSPYWRRRITDGDVEEVITAAEAPQKPVTKNLDKGNSK